MKILHDLVLISPTEETESPLFKPESSKETPQEGKVIAVGPEVEDINPGDNVVYRKWTGDMVNLEGKDLIVTRFEDILMVLDGE